MQLHGKSTITFTDKIFNNTDINWLVRLYWSFIKKRGGVGGPRGPQQNFGKQKINLFLLNDSTNSM